MSNSIRFCEFCQSHLDSSFASGRFCNRICANSFVSNQNIKEKNKKRSLTLMGRKNSPMSEETKKKLSIAAKARSAHKPIKIKGTILDITRSELESYRDERDTCEICEKKCITGRKLATDHDHKTNIFRGLLCIKCNMNYDWFVENAEGIVKYKEKTMRSREVAISLAS